MIMFAIGIGLAGYAFVNCGVMAAVLTCLLVANRSTVIAPAIAVIIALYFSLPHHTVYVFFAYAFWGMILASMTSTSARA